MADYQLQSSKLLKRAEFSGTGVIAPTDGHKLYGESFLSVNIENVDSDNRIEVQTRMDTKSTWTTIHQLVGTVSERGLSICGCNYVRFNVTNYSTSSGTPTITASGFFNSAEISAELPGISTSAYSDVLVTNLTPVINANATYGFIPSNFRTFTSGGGTATTEGNEFKVTSGTSLADYGTIQSFRSSNYREGLGAVFRFAARFPDSSALTWTGVGAINIGDELSFGYSSLNFGIWHRYNGKAEVRTLTVTGAAGGSENATVTINGTAYTVPLTAGTVQQNAHEIADYLTTNGSGIEAWQNDDTVIVNFLSDGAKSGTYSFSSSTATATWAQTTAGVTKTSTHIPVAEWNGTVFEDFDPSKGNVYQITYESGYGDIFFYIQDNKTGRFVNVHTIRWSNTQTGTNMINPSLRPALYSTAIGSTSNVAVYCAFLSAFASGQTTPTRNPRAFSNTKSIATTKTNILTIRNRKVYQGLPNQVEIEPRFLTLANDGTKTALFELRGNPTVAGTPNFQDAGTNLVSEYDTSGTTVSSNGRLLGSYVVAKGQSININLSELQIRQPPSLRLVISGEMVSGSAADLTASFTWYEDI